MGFPLLIDTENTVIMSLEPFLIGVAECRRRLSPDEGRS